MSEFKKGQLVAVKVYSDENWEPAIFERKEGIFCICRSLLNRDARLERPWAKAKPAEEVWPDIFLGWERSAGEQAADAVAMESELVKRLRRQVAWLCQELAHADMCPSVSAIASCDKDCPGCWEQASLKAVGEDANDQA